MAKDNRLRIRDLVQPVETITFVSLIIYGLGAVIVHADLLRFLALDAPITVAFLALSPSYIIYRGVRFLIPISITFLLMTLMLSSYFRPLTKTRDTLKSALKKIDYFQKRLSIIEDKQNEEDLAALEKEVHDLDSDLERTTSEQNKYTKRMLVRIAVLALILFTLIALYSWRPGFHARDLLSLAVSSVVPAFIVAWLIFKDQTFRIFGNWNLLFKIALVLLVFSLLDSAVISEPRFPKISVNLETGSKINGYMLDEHGSSYFVVTEDKQILEVPVRNVEDIAYPAEKSK